MILDRNKALVRAFHEAFWNDRRESAQDEFLAEDCVVQWNFASRSTSRQWDLEVRETLLRAFPDFRVSFEAEIADDDAEVVEGWTLRGAHRGAYLGVPPSGQPASLRGCTLCRVSDGKIVKITRYVDMEAFRSHLSWEERQTRPRGGPSAGEPSGQAGGGQHAE